MVFPLALLTPLFPKKKGDLRAIAIRGMDSSCESTQKEIMLTGIYHWNCLENHSAKLFEK